MNLIFSTIQMCVIIVFLSICLSIWFQLTGFVVCTLSGMKDFDHTYVGVISTITCGVYIAFFDSTSKVVLVMPMLLVILLMYTLLKKPHFYKSRRFFKTLITEILKKNIRYYSLIAFFSIFALISYISQIRDFAPGIISFGNPDPINYGLVSRNMAENGFQSSLNFANADLARQAAFDWTGTMSFLAAIYSLGQMFSINPSLLYLTTITFMVSFFCYGLLRLGRLMYSSTRRLSSFSAIILILLLISSQLNQYIIGQGFLAQILFTSILPHGILMLVQYLKSLEMVATKSNGNFIQIFMGLALGVSIIVYAPLGLLFFGVPILIIPVLTYKLMKKYTLRSRVLFTKCAILNFIGLVVGVFPLLSYFRVPNSRLLISEKNSMPGWKLEQFNLFNFLPGQILCLPGESDCPDSALTGLGSFVTFVFLILFLIGYISRNKKFSTINKVPVYLLVIYVTILITYFVLRYGYAAYPTWKFSSYAQILGMFVSLPFAQRGVDIIIYSKNQFKKKEVVSIKRINLVLLICTLGACVTISTNLNSQMYARSVYAFSTPKWMSQLDDQNFEQFSKGVNIELGGYDGMLAAYYLPIEFRAITKTSGYYNGIERSYPYILSDSGQADVENVMKELSRVPSILITR